MYYGMVAVLDKVTKHIVPDSDKPKVEALPQADFMINFEKVRHGYGLQIYNGQRNADGILTKFEGQWNNNQMSNGLAVYADGSTYQGPFKNDLQDGEGVYKWIQGHEYQGNFKEGMMDGKG